MNKKPLIGLLAFVGIVGASPLLLRPTPVSPAAIQKAVVRTPALLSRAWALPAAAAYKHELRWQSNPSICGPASLANTFRSLGEAAATEEQVLHGSGRCWSGYCVMGLTLDQVAEVAKLRTRRQVTVLRDLTPEAFLSHLRRANEPGRRYLINFTRKPIFGGGGGHHSPIGGYLEAEDLVFVLDVNRDFQPWLIERQRLFAAMDTLDGAHKRGMVLIE